MEVRNVYNLSVFGNPGVEYEKTKHNVGFRVIDKIAENLKIDMSKNKFDAIICSSKELVSNFCLLAVIICRFFFK